MLLKKEGDELQSHISKMREYVYQLIYPDGTPRPGVTREQLLTAHKVVKKMKHLINETSEDFVQMNDGMRKDHDETRGFLLEMQKKYNCKFTNPLMKKMYNL